MDFFNIEGNVNRWLRFFDKIDKNKKILDFGCGPGYSILVGKYLGYDITGLDLYRDFNSVTIIFDDMRIKFGINKYVVTYDLGDFPFTNNEFDIVICKAVLDKKYKPRNEVTKELSRIIKTDGIFYITPKSHILYLKHLPQEKICINKEKDTVKNSLVYDIIRGIND